MRREFRQIKLQQMVNYTISKATVYGHCPNLSKYCSNILMGGIRSVPVDDFGHFFVCEKLKRWMLHRGAMSGLVL